MKGTNPALDSNNLKAEWPKRRRCSENSRAPARATSSAPLRGQRAQGLRRAGARGWGQMRTPKAGPRRRGGTRGGGKGRVYPRRARGSAARPAVVRARGPRRRQEDEAHPAHLPPPPAGQRAPGKRCRPRLRASRAARRRLPRGHLRAPEAPPALPRCGPGARRGHGAQSGTGPHRLPTLRAPRGQAPPPKGALFARLARGCRGGGSGAFAAVRAGARAEPPRTRAGRPSRPHPALPFLLPRPAAALTCSPRPARRSSWSPGSWRGRRARPGGSGRRARAERGPAHPEAADAAGGGKRASASQRGRGLGGRGRRARLCSGGGRGSREGNARSPSAPRVHTAVHTRTRARTCGAVAACRRPPLRGLDLLTLPARIL